MSRASWRDVLPIHPAAELFPLMMPDELKALGEDIKKNDGRLREPVAIWRDDKGEPFLLDGRNRLDAMEAVGITVWHSRTRLPYQYDFVSADPYGYVISANLHRRHLDADDKRKVIVALLKAQPEKSNRTIAEQVKASHHTVGAVRAELQSTGQVAQLEKTVGKDGKARKPPAHKPATTVAVAAERRMRAVEKKARETAKEIAARAKTPPPDLPARALPPFDPGPAAASEVERLTARIAELENQKRLLEIKIVGLGSEIEELKAQLAAAPPQPSAPAATPAPAAPTPEAREMEFQLDDEVELHIEFTAGEIERIERFNKERCGNGPLSDCVGKLLKQALDAKGWVGSPDTAAPAAPAPPSAPAADGEPLDLREDRPGVPNFMARVAP